MNSEESYSSMMKNIAGMIIGIILVLPWNLSSAGELSRGLSEALGNKASPTMVPVVP
jgi:hypothetical protein